MSNMHTKEFLVGAMVGSLLGGVAALLSSPSSGKDLREDLCDTYCDLSEKANEIAKKGRCFANNFSDQTCDLTSKAKTILDCATKKVRGWMGEEEEEEECCSRDLLIGGLLGGVIGVSLALLLTPKPGKALRRDLVDAYDDISERSQEFRNSLSKRGKAFGKAAQSKTSKWLSLAQSVVEQLNEGANEKGNELIDQVRGLINNKKLGDMLDWAQLGFSAWQNFHSKKRK